jgi:hypothetical protein
MPLPKTPPRNESSPRGRKRRESSISIDTLEKKVTGEEKRYS